jgi:hypothetical protein
MTRERPGEGGAKVLAGCWSLEMSHEGAGAGADSGIVLLSVAVSLSHRRTTDG